MAALRTPAARWVLVVLGVLAFLHYWLGRADGTIARPSRDIADEPAMQPDVDQPEDWVPGW
jgi:hypothetical protein